MKFSLILLLILLTGYSGQTQTIADPPSWQLEQLYLSFGPGGSFLKNPEIAPVGQNFSTHVSAAFANNLIFRTGVLVMGAYDAHTLIRNPSYKKKYPLFRVIDNTEYHKLVSPFLAVGKRKPLTNIIQLQGSAGLSYSQYTGIKNYSSQGPVVYYFYSEEKIRYKPGLLFQAEAMIAPTRFAGFTIGGYYHYVPEISNGGFTLNFNLGKIRTKEIPIL